MRRKFKRTATLLASLAISVAQIQTPAIAETNIETNEGKLETNESGKVINNAETGVVTNNAGTINDNKGEVSTNTKTGVVNTNEGTITSNKGTVTTNTETGEVKTNTGNIIENDGHVKTNSSAYGTIDKNEGTITTNNGVVKNNTEKGKVENNKGTINVNNGEVDKNQNKVEINLGTINKNTGVVGEKNNHEINHGTIVDNRSDIELNAGKNDLPEGYIKEDLPNYTGGTIIENHHGIIIYENRGTIEHNKGTVSHNHGMIDTNEARATVTINGDTDNPIEPGTFVVTNNGSININYAIVEINNNEIDGNRGIVSSNKGYIKNNTIEGSVHENSGEIKSNYGDIAANTGTITTNKGDVGYVPDDLLESKPTGKEENLFDQINTSFGNYGEIETNSGFVSFNAGKNDIPVPEELLSEFDTSDYEGATIKINTSVIFVNNGTVETNTIHDTKNKKGTIRENNGTVKNNEAEVITNTKSGIVVNSGNGVVVTNYGKVYNNGGTITTNKGTEYFSVTISSGKNMSQKDKGLTTYDNKKWLGQDGDKQTSTTITVTPSSGYYISGIDVPDEVKSNVSVSRNPDGTWTISVTSGTNIALSLPDAIYKYTSSSSDDDNGNDDSKPQNNKELNISNLLVNMEPQNGQQETLQNIVDNNGNPINLDLSTVLKPLESKASALNNFNTPVDVNLNDIQGYGMISLSQLFAASSTADTISVPVAANVAAGVTYKVYLSNNTSIDVLCTQSGQLTIPFDKGTADLTFMICGTALTPATDTQYQNA